MDQYASNFMKTWLYNDIIKVYQRGEILKKNILYFLCPALLMIGIIAFGDSVDLSYKCEELLAKRAEAWNNILVDSYSYSEFYNDMNAIAAGELLKEDLETFIYLRQNPTSMERVLSVKFNDKEIKREKNRAFITGKVIWELEGHFGVEIIENDYNIELERYKRNWYIIKFEPVE